MNRENAIDDVVRHVVLPWLRACGFIAEYQILTAWFTLDHSRAYLMDRCRSEFARLCMDSDITEISTRIAQQAMPDINR